MQTETLGTAGLRGERGGSIQSGKRTMPSLPATRGKQGPDKEVHHRNSAQNETLPKTGSEGRAGRKRAAGGGMK